MNRALLSVLTAAGLLVLGALLAIPPTPVRLMGAAPLAALAIGALATLQWPGRWIIVIAIFMLPYFSFGVMEMITNPDARIRAVAFSTLTVGVFLAALDCARSR